MERGVDGKCWMFGKISHRDIVDEAGKGDAVYFEELEVSFEDCPVFK
jgi:hypothetical protein